MEDNTKLSENNISTDDESESEFTVDGMTFFLDDAYRSASLIRYRSSEKNPVIPRSVTRDGIEYTVESLEENAFFVSFGVTSVSIPDSVKHISNRVFNGTNNLESINVAQSNAYFSSVNGVLFNKAVTKLIYYPPKKKQVTYAVPSTVTSIGDYAFFDVGTLESIILPENLVYIGDCAFLACGGLQSMIVPDSVRYIGESAFHGCCELIWVVLGKSVQHIGERAFLRCYALRSVRIPESVTYIGAEAFAACTKLVSVALPSSLDYLGTHAFRGCSSLESVNLKNMTGYIADNAFQACPGHPDDLRSRPDW